MGAFQFRMAMAWQRVDSPEKVRPLFSRDNPAFQIVPELAPRPSEAIVDKIAMSAFEGTYLEMALRDCGIRSFIIVGIALEIGIDPTCRHAADLERQKSEAVDKLNALISALSFDLDETAKS